MMIAAHHPLMSLLSLLQSAVRPPKPKVPPLGADELRAMSDHQLKDLGIGRSEVDYWLAREDATSA